MKYDYFGEYKSHWEANVWIYNGKGDPLFLESYTTKREAVKAIKDFVKSYKGSERLDCFVNHFDETQCTDNLGFDVEF